MKRLSAGRAGMGRAWPELAYHDFGRMMRDEAWYPHNSALMPFFSRTQGSQGKETVQ